jgi:hypothetical protein
MTPDEFARTVTESTEHERLQVFLLQRIAGYLNVIQYALGLVAFLLFLLLLR